MKFSFTAEQDEFRAAVRRYLADRSPTTEVRRLMATEAGFDRAAWQAMNAELGLCAVRIPEAHGGHGFGFTEHCIVLEEMGRALFCAPYFASTVLAAGALLHGANEDEQAAYLPGIASGETIATLAAAEDSGRWDAASVTLAAQRQAEGWRLNGHKSFVLDGHTADLILVLARAPGSTGLQGLSLFAVQSDAPGLQRRALATMDATRKLARLTFESTPAQLLGTEGAAASAFERVMIEAAVCLANEMVGGASRLREDALEYAKMRVQFGKSIASFQSMKHKQADMLLEVELAKSAAYYAAGALDEGDADAVAVASLAKAGASDTYLQTAVHAIQIHGGIGFTWDQDTHLWFKRAKSSEVLFGDAHEHRERMMAYWEGADA
ncbi:MAG: acyl-CoA dehydrogenase family protein [Burkholderiaceae bacterium]